MRQDKKGSYRENIVHMTGALPYSVHRSFFGERDTQALYLHWHPEMELYYLEAGTVKFVVENRSFIVCAGEVVFVPGNLLHGATSLENRGGSFRALVFSGDLIADPGRGAGFVRYLQPVFQDALECCCILRKEEDWQQEVLDDLKRLFELEDIRDGGGADCRLAAAGLIAVIWQQLYNRCFSKTAAKQRPEDMQKVADYIQAHYQEEISLEMLAQTAHMSEGQLCRRFHRDMGETPFTWLKRCRIKKSCAWLAASDKKVAEICTLCGFNNVSYFNREFLREMKITPSEYRKLCKNPFDKTGE